jgi:UDPglucose 6-dehydrogenase
MKLGIIGQGVVGTATRKGLELLGHDVAVHDLKFSTKIQDLSQCEIIFVCVPTPSAPDGSCDVSIIESVVLELKNINFQGIVSLKSTVPPGTTERLSKETGLEICFVPEFLREKYAQEDFVCNHHLLVVGTDKKEVYDRIVESHGYYPRHRVMMKPVEAELLKYYSNVYNALRVVFANAMYDVAEAVGADYEKIKETYLLRGQSVGPYLSVKGYSRGYDGACLPKDTKALAAFVHELGLDIELFSTIDSENTKFRS